MSTNATAIAAAKEAAAREILYPWRATNFSANLLALCTELFMAGLLTQQLIQWFTYRGKERKFIIVLVYIVIIESIAMTGINMALVFDHFAVHFGEYAPFENVNWTGFWPIVDTAVATTVQIFYLERAFLLNNRNWWIVGAVCILWPAAWATALATQIIYANLSSESEAKEVANVLYVWFASLVSIDVIITVSVGYGLYKSRTGWSSTDQMISKLMLLSVETQLPPTIITISFLITYCIVPSSFLCMYWEAVQSKFYVVGFLSVLNSRHHLRREMDGGGSDWNTRQQKTNTFAMKNGRSLAQETVNVVTETYVESYTIKPDVRGVNRQHSDLKEITESDAGSADELDYRYNASKTGLTDPSQV
ncbi:hypothetical protein P7C73_g2658, partial [Tremellales sp. Uapishka_1]